MLGWIVAKLAIMTVNLTTSYAIIPFCGFAATHVATHAGSQIVQRFYRKGADKLRGLVTVTLKCARIYIINKGEIIEIDPRKKYIIERGEIKMVDYVVPEMHSVISNEVNKLPPESNLPHTNQISSTSSYVNMNMIDDGWVEI